MELYAPVLPNITLSVFSFTSFVCFTDSGNNWRLQLVVWARGFQSDTQKYQGKNNNYPFKSVQSYENKMVNGTTQVEVLAQNHSFSNKFSRRSLWSDATLHDESYYSKKVLVRTFNSKVRRDKSESELNPLSLSWQVQIK